MTIQVGIFLYDEVEVLDFSGPFEAFSTASRVHGRRSPESADLFKVFTVAEEQKAIKARGGLRILPDFNLAGHPEIDVLIIPGGIVTDVLAKPHVISWIQKTSHATEISASVCTGAFLLAKAGLLQSKRATTHWEDADDLVSMFPDIRIESNVRWVDEGQVVTSAGISAGIDMSLHLVSRLADEQLAALTAIQMEFDWTQNTLPIANTDGS